MTKQLNEIVQESVELALKEYQCKVLDCDGEGTYSDGGEPAPCQYCHTVRLPMKNVLISSQISLLEHLKQLAEGREVENEKCRGNFSSVYINAYSHCLEDDITYLESEIKKIKMNNNISLELTKNNSNEKTNCEFCDGTGEVAVTEQVYQNEPHMACTDTKKCICQINN